MAQGSFVNRRGRVCSGHAYGLTPDEVARLLGKPTGDEIRAANKAAEIEAKTKALEAERQRVNEAARKRREQESA